MLYNLPRYFKEECASVNNYKLEKFKIFQITEILNIKHFINNVFTCISILNVFTCMSILKNYYLINA